MPFNSEGKPHGNGKKPHKFTYTYKDISRITGLKVSTLRAYASRGIFNPYSFYDTFYFLTRWINQHGIIDHEFEPMNDTR